MKQAGILPARMGKSGNPLIAALRPSDCRLEIEVYPELEGTTLSCRVMEQGGGEAFSDAGGHWNPAGCPHPYHAGDLPPVFATASGRGFLAVLTDRFSLPEVVGHTVILHGHLDDFTTQPSGSAGETIACGVIRRLA